MTRAWIWVVFAASAAAGTQQSVKVSTPGPDAMIATVSREDAGSKPNVGAGRTALSGTAYVEPIAWLTSLGEWKKIACDFDHPQECLVFDREYLRKPHNYRVVSAIGRGASVHVEQMHLTPNDDPNDCFGYGGGGDYSGAPINGTAVAASLPKYFAVGPPARQLTERDAEPVRKALAEAVGDKLDSAKYLRVYSLRINGKELLSTVRTYRDFTSKPEYLHGKDEPLELIFALGTMENGHFHLLFWKENTMDENEQIIGTIRLKDGQDFLVNGVSDPESGFFRIYGIRNGNLTMVFAGGGGCC